MHEIRFIILLFFVTLALHASAQTKKVTDSNKVGKVQSGPECIKLLRFYKDYWIGDSLAKSGFRELLGDKILCNCDLKNVKWSDVFNFLGKPNLILKDEKYIEYRYRLNNYTDDLYASGNMYLDIYVAAGVIIRFFIRTIDG